MYSPMLYVSGYLAVLGKLGWGSAAHLKVAIQLEFQVSVAPPHAP